KLHAIATIYTLSLHDALPILLATASALPKQRLKDALAKGAVWLRRGAREQRLRRATKTLLAGDRLALYYDPALLALVPPAPTLIDRKSTRLNSSHVKISYAVF